MSDAALIFETRGPVAWLTLNRPKAMNSISLEMIELYEEYLPKIAADDSIRVLVLTGVGKAFCAGADLTQVLAKVEIGFKEELAKMLKDGFTDEEVANAKSGLLQGKKVSRAQDRELVGKLVSNLDLDRSMQWNKTYEKSLENLTAKDVNRVMKKYLKLEDFSIIKAGDMSKVEAN